MRFDTTPKLPVSITVKRAVLDAAMMLEDHCAAAGLDATEAAAWLADWAEIGWPWGGGLGLSHALRGGGRRHPSHDHG